MSTKLNNLVKKPSYLIDEFNLEIHRVAYLLDKKADVLLREDFKISLAQFRILLAVLWKPNIRQVEIAKLYNLTTAGIGRLIGVLIEKQLLTREINTANRREHILKITLAGRKLAKEALKQIYALSQFIHEKISKKDYKLIISTLRDLTIHLTQYEHKKI